jgi:hypothetical protein
VSCTGGTRAPRRAIASDVSATDTTDDDLIVVLTKAAPGCRVTVAPGALLRESESSDISALPSRRGYGGVRSAGEMSTPNSAHQMTTLG